MICTHTHMKGPNSLFLTQAKGCFSVSVGLFWLVFGEGLLRGNRLPRRLPSSVKVCVFMRVCV